MSFVARGCSEASTATRPELRADHAGEPVADVENVVMGCQRGEHHRGAKAETTTANDHVPARLPPPMVFIIANYHHVVDSPIEVWPR
jgi:hypothetical protein